MFQNLVSLIEKVDDQAGLYAGDSATAVEVPAAPAYDDDSSELSRHKQALEEPARSSSPTPSVGGSNDIHPSQSNEALIAGIQHGQLTSSSDLPTVSQGTSNSISLSRAAALLRQRLDEGGSSCEWTISAQHYLMECTGGGESSKESSVMSHMENTIHFLQQQLQRAEMSNAHLKKQLDDNDAVYAVDRESWAAEWGRLSAQSDRVPNLMKEVERRKEEVQQAWARIASLQMAVRESEGANQKLEALQKTVQVREDELARVQADMHRGMATSIVEVASPHMIGGSLAAPNGVGRILTKWPVLHACLQAVDKIVLLVCRLLVRHVWVRLFAACYICIIHLHMVHFASFAHTLPHAETGDDVHDHIRNHMFKS